MDEWLLWGDSSQFTKTFAIFNNYLFWIFTWRESNSMRVLTFICGLLFMSMFLVTKSERILNKQLSLTQIKKTLQLWQTIFGFHVPFSNKTN